jgi:hypothetical protein
VYGAPLCPRGLLLAPTTELGVVFLFGVLAPELGFAVLRIQPSFPDCEALRAPDPAAVRSGEVSASRWQRVRIEFEFRSSSFRQHGHDAAGCDLIVCWEDDWPEAPVEVVELRKYVAGGVGRKLAN